MKMKHSHLIAALLCVVLSLALISCDSVSTNPFSDANSGSVKLENKVEEQLLRFAVQRGAGESTSGLSAGEQNDPENPLEEQLNLLEDIRNLMWIAPRGGAGITGETVSAEANALPVVSESEMAVEQSEELWYKETASSNTWIRLFYTAYMPEEGVNAWGHYDILLCVDTENSNDALLMIQDPQLESTWKVVRLPQYGQWLSCEIDMLLRLYFGM